MVELGQNLMFQDNGHGKDLPCYLLLEIMILKLKYHFILLLQEWEDFLKKFRFQILEPWMELEYKTLDLFKLSGDQLKTFTLHQKVVL